MRWFLMSEKITKEELMKIIGKRIRTLRESRGWYQRDLSKKLGTFSNVISDFEYGKRMPNQVIIYELSEIFNVSTDYIYGKEKKTVKERKLTEEEKEAIQFSKLMKKNGYSIYDVKRIMNIIIEVNKK